MPIVKGVQYRRDQIVLELGVSDYRDRAVLLDGNLAVAAIVIKKNGINLFNGKTYANALTNEKLVMTGENDDRGRRLEDPEARVPLFFAENNDGLFRYEGLVRYTGKLSVPGDPIREFERLP